MSCPDFLSRFPFYVVATDSEGGRPVVRGWYCRADAQDDAYHRAEWDLRTDRHSYKVITRAGLKRIDAYDPYAIAEAIDSHPGVESWLTYEDSVWVYLKAPWVCTTSATGRTIHEGSVRAAWAHLQGARPRISPTDIAADEAAYARTMGGAR